MITFNNILSETFILLSILTGYGVKGRKILVSYPILTNFFAFTPFSISFFLIKLEQIQVRSRVFSFTSGKFRVTPVAEQPPVN